MVNDINALNPSLMELGETMATNISSKGVSADAFDGLTTLASKILQIQTGGGASNFVTGTFTTGSSGDTTGTVNLNYNGNGYPIVTLIFVDGGIYNESTSWYTTVARYDVGMVLVIKANTNTAPTYTTSGTDNNGILSYIYKTSTSNAKSYAWSGSKTVNAYTTSSNVATAGNNMVRFKGDGKTLSYYVGNRTSSTYGLARDTTFRYMIIYSQ